MCRNIIFVIIGYQKKTKKLIAKIREIYENTYKKYIFTCNNKCKW